MHKGPVFPKPKWKFTERQKIWIRNYFKSSFNATQAARVAYGGTSISCRVKGWRKRTKFDAILEEIFERELYEIEGGVEAYLAWLEHGNRQRLQEIERKQKQVSEDSPDLWPNFLRKLQI